MKLVTRAKVLLFSAGLALSGASSAVDFHLGDVTGAPAFFTNGFVDHTSGAFTDDFFFTVSLPSYGGTTIANQPIISFGQIIRDIVGLTASFYFDSGAVGVADAADTLYGAPSGPNSYITGSAPLVAGNYYIQVSGTAVGLTAPPSPIAGTYSYSGFVSSVPEPETYVMMLAGILMMGVIARRRINQI